jgi:hypothetical protein
MRIMVRRVRALPVSAAALAWLIGLYALPLAHNLDHRDDHTHGPEPAEHSHPHEPHDKVPLDSDHGSASVLHFAAAALQVCGIELPQIGPRALLPEPPSPRVAPSIPDRVVLVRGPPVIDFL